MGSQPRNSSAIVVSALVFGSIASPFFYLARGLGGSYTAEFLALAAPLLTVSGALLLLALTRQSGFEQWLRQRLGKTFAPFFYSLLLAAFLLTGAILGVVANFSLLTAVEYWYYFAIILGICVAGALVVVVVTPPSRLESAVQLKLTVAGPTRVYWRILSHAVLLALLLFCAWAVYRKLARDEAALESIGWQPRPDIYAAMGEA